MIPLKKMFSFRKKETVRSTNDFDIQRDRSLLDPLDHDTRGRGWENTERVSPIQRDVDSFPTYDPQAETQGGSVVVGDAAIKGTATDDSNISTIDPVQNAYTMPPQLQNWYMSQSFIGYQACALIAQHWLVDKACSMAGEDAVRNGWTLKAKANGSELSDEDNAALSDYDIPFKLKENLVEFNRFKNVFGIRVALFEVDSEDPDYYQKPFNIDGVTKDSYKGISQVDPYWMMPMMTAESTSDPSSQHFYDPEFWVISGRRYHRSHLIIARGPQPADILKPTYIFGGVPLTQRIYERVYAAERTANEAPLLAMNKRTTAIHVDMEKAVLNEKKFSDRLAFWVRFRDNHAVKVLGKEETMEQFDTNLTDFDSIIMNQYQLVSAISKVPATKLLGTSPKGFNATGEFETVSYHEELESIQENVCSPLLERHYLILGRSLGIECEVCVVWEPVDAMTAGQQAEVNAKKAAAREAYVNMGAVSPDEVRHVLRDDKNSGFNRLNDDDANDEPGMTPENLAALEKAGAANVQAQGRQMSGTAALASADPKALTQNGQEAPETDAGGLEAGRPDGQSPMAPATAPEAEFNLPLTKELLKALSRVLGQLNDAQIPEGQDIAPGSNNNHARTTRPSVQPSVNGNVAGAGQVIPAMEPSKLPKMKVGGMVIAVENPRGSIRKGQLIDGTQWASKMPAHYGFIKGTNGADGEEMDCFIGPNLKSQMVYVVNQNDTNSGEFDEHKCMIGFDSVTEARAAYQAAYSMDWEGFDSIVPMGIAQFKEWLKGGDCQSPLSAENIGSIGQAPETT